MRPYLLFFLILQLLRFPAWGQETPMISDLTTVPFSISDAERNLQLQWSANSVRSSFQNFEVIRISNLYLEGLDLYIEYTLPNQSADLDVAIGIGIEATDSTLIDANPKEITFNLSTDRQGANTLIWRNIIGDQIEPGESYLLLIRTDIFGDVCAQAPVLNIAGQLPYYGGAVIGLGLIGAGQLVKKQADVSYQNYQQLWADGNNEDAALLEQVEKDQKTAQLLTYGGIGVLGLDAILFYLKNRKHRKAVRRYNTFCVGQKVISVHPKYHSSTNMGFMLRVNF